MTEPSNKQALFLCYPRCSTCAKARTWLNDNEISFIERDIKINNPTYKELEQWVNLSNLPIKRFFNTSGMSYRKLDAAHRPDALSQDDALCLLASDGMLVKRPIVIVNNQVLVGFRPKEWEEAFGDHA